MQTETHNMGREERRAQLEQRRSAVAHQLRRLAIELTELDRQLDDIEQSEGRGTPSALEGHTADE
jgi:septal ring factor EnvC (AmiA/AmiB activator)